MPNLTLELDHLDSFLISEIKRVRGLGIEKAVSMPKEKRRRVRVWLEYVGKLKEKYEKDTL